MPDRSVRHQIAAHRLHALHDSREITAAARRAFLDRFEREVDPGAVLPPDERARRAAHARKAYFTELGRRSGKARRGAA